MTSILSSYHPQASTAIPDWVLMRDAYKGERQVKSKTIVYLPMTSAQEIDGALISIVSAGYKSYNSYKTRARFSNYVREAIQLAIGMMHSQPPEIKLPKAMENIKSRKGESLQAVLQNINEEQLLSGRIGLMLDLPSNPAVGEDMPYLATYVPERIINWDDGTVEQLVPQSLGLVVIDETEFERSADFSWNEQKKYRVLMTGSTENNESRGVYRQGVFKDGDFVESQLMTPSWRGKQLDKLPFVIINSCDITPDVDDPPLLDLGNLCMTIYRADADYRQNLFMQGQDTFVISGGSFDEAEEVRVGAGSRLELPMGGEAKYVGVTSSGLSEQRQSLDRLESRASSMGAQTTDSTSRERESGDSLRIRVAARTADLNTVAIAGAAGLQHILRIAAEWMGENPEEVIVIPNKEFGEMPLTGQSMVEISTARNLGWPISARSMHDLAVKRRMTTKTFDEEVTEANGEGEDFVFGKQDNGDRASVQPNGGGPAGQNSVAAQSTNPSGRDAQ